MDIGKAPYLPGDETSLISGPVNGFGTNFGILHNIPFTMALINRYEGSGRFSFIRDSRAVPNFNRYQMKILR